MIRYRVGQVSELQPEAVRVRVVFDAADELVSWWLPVLQPKTLADQVYWMPDLGEHVVCLLDEHAEDGVVLGAIYSEASPPPIADPERLHVRMKDGTTLEYDRLAHKLAIHLVAADADVEISTTRNVTLSAGGNVTVNVPAGKNIFVGGEAGEELATRTFVQQQYNTHLHISSAPGSPTSPPQRPSPLTPGTDITNKQKSE